MNVTKAVLIIAGLLLVTPAMAQTRHFQETVSTCTASVRLNYDATFLSYVEYGSNNIVNYRGSPRANFLFKVCMNSYGHPLGEPKE
jgi:hypothetical protein